ncbi:MAG TPA: winged helix DNA-binding domain-containing protein [Vicinamibacteria bacterium]|nr:winged helix DNA-binding domain-containing protein [Vicinamibacteria bacterium]
MTTPALRSRLVVQQIVRPRFTRPADLVRWMGAVQCQDYPGGLWAIALRLAGSPTEPDVERALAERTIVRTWPMRGTLHFVPAADARWMLRLLAPRMIARSAGRHRQLGLDADAFTKSRAVLTRALRGGRALTRPQAYAALTGGGVSTAGQRGIHILAHLAQQGLLCFGPRQDRQPTLVLLDEWVPASREPTRDEALATLADRYFASHGPATLSDFAWWTGLVVTDARAAVEAAGRRLLTEKGRTPPKAAPVGKSRPPAAVLLPPWDEYIVAFQDREHALGHLGANARHALAMVGRPVILIDGRVMGSWRRTLAPRVVRVHLDFWTPVTALRRRAVERAVARYGRFLGRTAEVVKGP